MNGSDGNKWNADGFVSNRALDIPLDCAGNGNLGTFGVDCRIKKFTDLNSEAPFTRFAGFRVATAAKWIKKHLHQAGISFIFHLNDGTSPADRGIFIGFGILIDGLIWDVHCREIPDVRRHAGACTEEKQAAWQENTGEKGVGMVFHILPR